jgi:hypothetical protein
LNNFDKLSILSKRNAVGAYWNRHYILTIGDTAYVYDEQADAWSTWSVKVGGAAMYGAENTPQFIPGDTMYFFKPGGNTVFRYGSSESDSASGVFGDFIMVWKSAPQLMSDRQKVLSSIGTWCYLPA